MSSKLFWCQSLKSHLVLGVFLGVFRACSLFGRKGVSGLHTAFIGRSVALVATELFKKNDWKGEYLICVALVHNGGKSQSR